MNLKQLAEKLELSQTTVSRALNGYPEVSEATRKRVELAAAEGNYNPSRRAISLATGKAMAISHVIPLASRSDVVNPIFGEFIAGASQTYAENGYELMLTVAETRDEAAIYRDLSSRRSVDGFILHSPQRNDPRIALLNEIGMPFVVHGRVSGCDLEYNWIDINNHTAFKQATQLLVDLGHTRIALINGEQSMNFAWRRLCGYREALNENNIAEDAALIASAELTESDGYRIATGLLSRPDRPTAILVSAYVSALGVRRAITEAGLIIGKDVSVIIHDDDLSYFDNGGPVPQFTATRSSVKEAGVLAAEMLLARIDNPDLATQSRILKCHLTMGASTGPYRAPG